MRKEVFLAIIIGFSLGLVITYGIWTANKALKETAPKSEITPQAIQEVTPSAIPPSLLIINSPEDNTLSDKEKIELAGKATPKAAVVVLYSEGEKILEADEGGNFSTEITLVGGSNEITVTSYNTDGNEATTTLTVVYSTAQI